MRKNIESWGGGSLTKKHNYQHIIVSPENAGGQQTTTNHDRRNPIFPLTIAVNDKGNNVTGITDIAPCLKARDYKGYAARESMIAVIEERKEIPTNEREE